MRRAVTAIAPCVALGLLEGVVVELPSAQAWYGGGPMWSYPMAAPGYYYAPYWGCGPAWCPPPPCWNAKRTGMKGKGKPMPKAKEKKPPKPKRK